jgi:hypothetical protein
VKLIIRCALSHCPNGSENAMKYKRLQSGTWFK